MFNTSTFGSIQRFSFRVLVEIPFRLRRKRSHHKLKTVRGPYKVIQER
jgi:hypothetical protein